MKNVKRIISSLLVAVFILTAAPMSGIMGLKLNLDWLDYSTKSSAEENELAPTGQCGENVYWSFDNNTGLLTISGNGSMYDNSNSDDSPFYENTLIKTVVIKNGVTSIGRYAFLDCTGLTSITIPNGVTSIGEGVFSCCTGLTSITIPNGVTSIGEGVFSDCSGLTSITIPNSVTSIGGGAFYGCSGLTSITIPNSVTSIGEGVFSYCSGLTSITISDSVESIGDYAFVGCTGLTSITISDSVESIGHYAFRGCTGLTSIIVDKNNKVYDSRDNCNAIIETKSNTLIQGCQNTVIPNGVTRIGDYAFDGCSGLTSITIPNSVTSIGYYAFRGCSGLTSITIPNSVTSIGDWAFSDCSGLTSITIPNSVTSIDDGAFSGCSGLTSIIVDKNNNVYDSRDNCNAIIETKSNTLIQGCQNTVIPSSVTSIGYYAFRGCSGLTSITIPNSVTSIGGVAFYDCDKLKDVYYTGSEDEWNRISIDYLNEELLNAVIHYNYNPQSHSHTLSHVIVPASCTVNGMEYDICTECGETFNEKVIPMSHKIKHVTVPSTCKVAGKEYDLCTECGETFNEKTLKLNDHTWGEWTVTTEPTTTHEGQEKRTCSVCGSSETRSIEKLKTIKDNKTGIEINYSDEYAPNTEIKVEEKFSGKSFQLINTAFGDTKSTIYDISTYNDGVKIQPNGEITVRVPLPAGFTAEKVFVCYVDSTNGKVTKIPCEVKDGYVIFKTDHFSEYAIVEMKASVKSVSIDDITLNYKKSTTLKPTIKADDGAKYKVEYSTSNAKVATVDKNGKVYAAKKGSATITCTVTDSNGNTVQDNCKVTVKYTFGQWLIKILLFGWIWY